MNRSVKPLALMATVLLLTTHRLPAPVRELPDSPSPTPAPATTHRTAPASSPKPKPSDVPVTTRSRFAGTWVGTMQTIPWGNWAVELTVDSNEATMTSEINGERPEVKKTRHNGDSIQAVFPAGFTAITWTITPQPRGATALVRMQAFMNDFTSVFHRAMPDDVTAKPVK